MSPHEQDAHQLRDAVAYFCMEYGLDERLPIYAGGLGILAGDTLKSAHDQQRHLVGVGIFWGEGYTRQVLDEHGQPRDSYAPTSRQVLRPTGVEVIVRIRHQEIPITAWRVDAYGNAPLYLLEPVRPEDRWITARLYGGEPDDRVAQEILLGVGGVRVLRELGFDVALYHFNEGHALFAGLELVRERVRHGATWHDAVADVRRRVIFTTHTPVPAGNEVHPLDRLEANGLTDHELTRERLRDLGGDPFEMTPAALRLSSRANAVAQLHGRTAQRMWTHVSAAAPIHAITNGVHVPTWQAPAVRDAIHGGGDDDALRAARRAQKAELIEEVRLRNGVSVDPGVLLIGFARRAATYKRANLVLRQLEWLTPLLHDGRVALLFSGKAHPRDNGGKAAIHEIADIARRYRDSVVFLDNYDMQLGRMLTRGCDVWLNNPRRPMEASGTSGMKAAANGVLNVSILDGWWDEACEHGVNGWGFGGRRDAHTDEDDLADLADLQRVLEAEVLPTWERDPGRWAAMMRASIHMAETHFSTDRMLRDYYRIMYEPALAELRGATSDPVGGPPAS